MASEVVAVVAVVAVEARTLVEQRMEDERFDREMEFYAVVLKERLRLRIVLLLDARGELASGAIAECLGLRWPNASQHLRTLQRARIVIARKESQRVYYRLAHPEYGLMVRCIHLNTRSTLRRLASG